MKGFGALGLSSLLALGFVLVSCSPAPRRILTQEERIADLHWLYSQFKQNYAPLQYKQQKYNFDFEQLKQKYLQEVATTVSNEDFYRLMHRFVAEFRDAHTSTTISSAALPKRATVTYLGFDGVRVGNKLQVTKLLPTISANSAYPIKVGDKITKLDGVALNDIITKEFVQYRNLGQEESNLTYHMPKIFNRNSLNQALPASDTAQLTVVRGEKEMAISLPWVSKDLYEFSKEQRAAAEKTKSGETFGAIPEADYFKLGFQALSGEVSLNPSILKKLSRKVPGFNFRQSFFFVDNSPTWSSKILQDMFSEKLGVSETPLDAMKKARVLPPSAIVLNPAATFPVHITAQKMLDKDNKPTGASKQVATIYLDTFSPSNSDEAVLKEMSEALKTLKAFGIKDVIIDLINNGGGSLVLGANLAQLLSPTKIVAPEIQFKLSETWLDEFESASLSGPSDAEREIARRIFDGLQGEMGKGLPLSRKWDYESLSPFSLKGNPDLEEPFNVYLLVNEMCASMCDIFTATLKDNKLTTAIVGTKTMGAGGNVVSHPEAPNSHLTVSQTESLIVRRDGSYVENNGVEPDVVINVSDSAAAKYTAVWNKAIELIVKAK